MMQDAGKGKIIGWWKMQARAFWRKQGKEKQIAKGCWVKLREQLGRWKQDAAAVIAYALLSVFCFIFYCLGMGQKQGLEPYGSRATLIRPDGNSYSYAEAVQMRARNQEAETPFSYALWGSRGSQLLQNPDLGRVAEAEILIVEGCSDLVLSSSVMLDGTEGQSCLIGEGVAQALFGVADATGLSITMEGCSYVVLGMLADVRQGAVFHAKNFPDAALDRINVRIPENVTLPALEQQLEWELGFAGTALDYRFINSFLGLMGVGFCFLLWAYLLRLMAAELKKYQCSHAQGAPKYKKGALSGTAYAKGLAARLACMLGILAILGIFLYFHGKVPEDFIPTKWSDFAFWERLVNEKSGRMSEWAKCEKRAPELLYLGKAARAAVYFTLSYLCYIVLRAIQFGRDSMQKARK